MKTLDVLRTKIFWIIDFFKGGTINKHFNEIKCIVENYNSSKSIELREKNLTNLLKHAVSTTPFYESYQDKLLLEHFPVIDKLIISNNFSKFKSKLFLHKKKFKVSTSGSTGTPFKLYQNANKRKRSIADTLYFAERAGFKLGTKLIYMRLWGNHNKKNKFRLWLQNMMMQDVTNLNDITLSKLVQLLKDNNEKGIIAYASSLDTLCKYLNKIKFEPYVSNINSIIAMSEHLNENTKSALQKYFMVPVVSRYSNDENGILSQQTIYSKGEFEINSASYYIEVLKVNEDSPAAQGEIGRVVVTDLFNYCMPIIRYDTGDIARIEFNNDNVPVFKKIEGRKLDLIYDTQGNLISSFLIGSLLENYTSIINQYQFIQEGEKDYVLKLNLSDVLTDELQLVSSFKKNLGEDCNLKINYVEEIPLLASGKRKEVLSNYKHKL